MSALRHNTRLTPSQRHILQTKINDLYGYFPINRAIEAATPPEPADVAKARKIVAAYDKVLDRRHEKIRERFNAAKRAAEESLHFETPADALAIVNGLKPLKVTK